MNDEGSEDDLSSPPSIPRCFWSQSKKRNSKGANINTSGENKTYEVDFLADEIQPHLIL